MDTDTCTARATKPVHSTPMTALAILAAAVGPPLLLWAVAHAGTRRPTPTHPSQRQGADSEGGQ